MLPKGYININHGFYYKPALEDVNWLDEINYFFIVEMAIFQCD